MGCCSCSLIGVAIATLILILAYIIKKVYSILYDIPELPKIDENRWWGLGDAKQEEDASITTFKINVTNAELEDLNNRLRNARPLIPPLEGIQHQYGINSNLLAEISKFWQTKYNWREREAFLNQYDQYVTKIQGLNIHFLHVKPKETNGLKVVPLLLLHGWPGSVREFYEVIPLFTEIQPGRDFVFEVVAPHLPGYGFSEGAVRPGLNPNEIAVILKNLMIRLKFDKWYVQGGDWGAIIGTQMSILYPKHVMGFHFNMASASTPIFLLKLVFGAFCPNFIVDGKNRNKLYPLGNLFNTIMREMGYMHLQATRPDSVGVALNDSPIGLAAYIIEKFIVWTNKEYLSREDGGLPLKYDYNKLLDNIMIYWITKSITTSCRLYAESFSKTTIVFDTAKIPVQVPSAYAQFEHDLGYANETLLKDKYTNMLQVNELETGGHFAAFEEPILFSQDVWNAVEKFENYHKKQH